jgi:hypothetical protein
MIKKLVFLMTVCVVARFCLAETTTKSTIRIKNVNDREMQQTVCNPLIKEGDVKTALTKMQKCLRQKRQEKLLNRQTRSLENQISIEKIIQTLKTLTEAAKNATSNTKLNVIVGFAEINNDITTLRCDESKSLKIIDARLTSQNYQDQCETDAQMDKETREMFADLNESCDEKVNTMINTVKMCDGKNQCQINVDANYTGICDCTQNKYVDITFTCVDTVKTRSKRALHYRNRLFEINQERAFRQALAQAYGLDYMAALTAYPFFGAYGAAYPFYGGAYPMYG